MFRRSARGCSSVGRARARQARGHGFDSHQLHKSASTLRNPPSVCSVHSPAPLLHRVRSAAKGENPGERTARTRLAPGDIRVWRRPGGSLSRRRTSLGPPRRCTDSPSASLCLSADRGMPTEVERIRREHVEAWIPHLLERWKPTTASARYRALQAFWRWAVDNGKVPNRRWLGCAHRSSRNGRRPSRARRTSGRCSPRVPSFEDRRVRALVLTLVDTGMRVSELVGMTTGRGSRTPRAPSAGERSPASSPTVGDGHGQGDRSAGARARHPRAEGRWLWLGGRGRITRFRRPADP
jgi:hypothetical protein